jgi:glycosyltransferase involved in cell wall biosynthesis
MIKERAQTLPSTLVIVAALNEEQGIGPTLAEVGRFLDKPFCLVVDGRSIDGTVKIAENMGARVVAQKGLGKGDAIATAITHAQTTDVQYAAFIDADYSYPAMYLPKMVDILERNPQVGMVCGNRFDKHLHWETMNDLFYVGNRFIAFSHSIMNGVYLRDPLTGLRVVRWEILKKWAPRSKGFDVEVELNRYVENQGYAIVEVPIHYRVRLGEKKLKLRHGFTILGRILAESFHGNRT